MRALFRTATITAAAAAATLVGAAPVRADGEWLRVNPTTIQAGFSVSIEASCGTNVNPAVVKSDAFGEQQMLPQQNTNYLHAIVTVPPSKRPAGYTVTLVCSTGGRATTTLWVIDMGAPSKGPHTGGGGLASGGADGSGNAALAAGVAAVGVGGLLLLSTRRRRRRAAAAKPPKS